MSMQPDPMSNPRPVVQSGVDAYGRPVAVEPVVAATPVAERVVVAQPAVQSRAVTAYGRRYAFDSLVVGVIGLALTIIGLIAAVRAGFDGSMDDPVVAVLGFNHTATLGLIEAGIGVCLLLCAAATSRAASIFFGLLLGIGAIVAAVQTSSFDESLAIESSWAWVLAVAAAIVVLVSLLIPRMVTRTARVETF